MARSLCRFSLSLWGCSCFIGLGSTTNKIHGKCADTTDTSKFPVKDAGNAKTNKTGHGGATTEKTSKTEHAETTKKTNKIGRASSFPKTKKMLKQDTGTTEKTKKILERGADTNETNKVPKKDADTNGNIEANKNLKKDGETSETNKMIEQGANTTEINTLLDTEKGGDSDTTKTSMIHDKCDGTTETNEIEKGADKIDANKILDGEATDTNRKDNGDETSEVRSLQTSKQTIRLEGKLDKFDEELSRIIGLADLKLQLRKWAKGLLLDEKRRATQKHLGARKPPHMAFLGNPGTGKTTVARIMGRLLHSVGVISSDKVTEVLRTDLVAEYLGQTGPLTRRKITEAMGGILFVDEAYRLAPPQKAGHHVDFGVEALEEIMSFLEDDNIVVIFAGYTEPMKRVFSSNEGFSRRVTHFFQFDDFTSKDLAEMLMLKMEKQDKKSRLNGFKLHPSCNFETVLELIEKESTENLRNKLNGGLVDHMLNNARENLDSRLSLESDGEELFTITLEDLELGLKQLAQRVNIDGNADSEGYVTA